MHGSGGGAVHLLLEPEARGPRGPRPSPRALSAGERQAVLDVQHEQRFADAAPAEVYASLLDERAYLCSIRTMYRILKANLEVRERRAQLRCSPPLPTSCGAGKSPS